MEEQKNNQTNNTESMRTIGKFLQEERNKRNLSLKQISQKTKISLTQLEYLEGDSLELLPNKAYVIGYLKSYSKILNMDPSELITHLENTYSLLSPSTEIVPKKELESSNSKLYLAGIGIVFIIAIFIFIFRTPEQKTDKPKVITTKKAPINLVNTEKHPQEKLNHEKNLKEQAKENSNTNLQNPTDSKKEKTKSIPTKVKETNQEDQQNKYTFRPLKKNLFSIITNAPQNKMKLFPDNVKEKIIKGKQNLYIYAHQGNSWVTYQIDNKQPRQRVIRENRSLSVAGETIRIFFGNVNATTAFLNGKLLNIPSSTGVRSLVIPEVKRTDYVLPLFIFNKETGKIISSKEFIENHKLKKP